MDHLKEPQAGALPSIDCSVDPIASLKAMFVDMVQAGRIAKGQCPALRPVFLKPHGVAAAQFRIRADLPAHYQVGLFAHVGKAFDAWVRFSSDTLPTLGDFKSTLGIGIKLFDVPGAKLIGNPDAPTFDFILQNFDVFFVNTAADMCAFTKAGVVDGDYGPYLAAHPETAELLDAMAKPVASVLATPYWSGLPFCFGDTYAKYKLEPTLYVDPPATDPADPTYLAADLASRLSAGAVSFRFMVQLRTVPDQMPLDEATVVWPEDLSPPIHVADLVIAQQDVNARGQAAYGENLSMNIWRVTEAHKPVGSIADARRVVYSAAAELRRDVNGVPVGEPEVPRPLPVDAPRGADTTIVRAAIHPAIGIARIGDAATEYFIGPEVVDAPPESAPPPNFYRDPTGAMKRQAARFRIYGYNAAGEVVRELTSDNADITWTVHVANRKSQWYQFQYALDIPEAVDAPDNAFPLRNPDIPTADRGVLAIDPGPRSISGRSVSGPAYAFDTGSFKGVPVPLGEVQTDADGRLIFLGGHGKSASPSGAPVYDPDNPPSFNNANDWYDDTSDGPVLAEVSINGTPVPVEGAWVVVAPPNYAPDIISWRTMYDLLCDVSVQAGWMSMPDTPSFTNDILPILQRLSNLQWVNKGFAAYFGKGCPLDFNNPALIEKLAQKPSSGDDPYGELRRTLFNNFRPEAPSVAEPVAWPHVQPWIYGDAFGSFSATGPGNMLTMTGLQEAILRKWVEGSFIADWPAALKPVTKISEVPLAEQPHMLDKAALHYCLSDTFHPGCEMTWPMRHASLYSAPFRIRLRPADQPEPDYGPTMTPLLVEKVGGPLYAQPPGGITRWMAIPWQGDTAFCRSGYDPEYDPYLPTFWAARVPNQVLTEADYAKVIDTSLPRAERVAAYNRRASWLRAIQNHQTAEVMMDMIADFGQLGIVEARPGVKDDPDFPEYIYVETLAPGTVKAAADKAVQLLAAAPQPAGKLERAGWASQEQLEAFRAVRVQKR